MLFVAKKFNSIELDDEELVAHVENNDLLFKKLNKNYMMLQKKKRIVWLKKYPKMYHCATGLPKKKGKICLRRRSCRRQFDTTFNNRNFYRLM